MFAVVNIAVLKTFNICIPFLQALGLSAVNNVLYHAT